MPIKHNKVSTIPDTGDPSEVLPSDWNDDHDLSTLELDEIGINHGEATLNFSTGEQEATVAVTGQTAIEATAKVRAWIMADDTTADHTANDHRFIGLVLALSCGNIVAGTGFTIYAMSLYELVGQYKVRWMWTKRKPLLWLYGCSMKLNIIKSVVQRVPAVIPYLTGRARYIALALSADEKTAEDMQSRLTSLVKALYGDTIKAPEFVDALAALVSRQITLAYREAWKDEGSGEYPQYLTDSAEAMILNQFDFVDGFARDIVDARIDGKPIDGLLARVPLWANQYNSAYEEARRLIFVDNGGNLEWVKGETENGCSTCADLNGIIMSAKEWETLGVHPRGYPNPKLECEGGGPGNFCDCKLEPTDKRRSPNAYGRVEEIIL